MRLTPRFQRLKQASRVLAAQSWQHVREGLARIDTN